MKKPYTIFRGVFLVSMLFLLGTTVLMAQRTITGVITDGSSGDALIGANILAVGTAAGTVTDIDGSYSLSVPDGVTQIEVSYTGYASQTITLDASNTLDVALSAGTILDEVVVVGYGTSKRKDLTGSVGSVKSEDFNGGVVAAPDQLVQGKVAGVQMINNNGQPGGATTFRIRGSSSVRSGSNPLFVVDGVPLDGRSAKPGAAGGGVGRSPGSNPLNWLNPNDIESIDVLKDASATAIYGSRGANGVVLITTKKGKSGTAKVDFNTYVGMSSILRKVDVLDGDEYNAALSAYGISSTGNENVDALDEITRTAISQNYNFSIGGGNDRGNYRISAGLLDQDGIVEKSGLKKYTGNFNGNYDFLGDRLNVDFNLIASHAANENAPISDDAGFTGSLIGNALQWNPTVPLIQPDGSYTRLSASTLNPLELSEKWDDTDDVTTVLGSISPSVKLTDNLKYKYIFSVNKSTGIRERAIASTINIDGIEGKGGAGYTTEDLLTIQHTHTLTYEGDLTDNIGVNAVVGYEYQKFDKTSFGFASFDYPLSDVLDYDFLSNAGATPPAESGGGRFVDPSSELQSYFGRVNFNVNDKLNVTATLRADGSSKFGENNRYGVFPSFAAAYDLTDQLGGSFDNFKVRVGWGQVGNQEFPAGAAQAQFVLGPGGSLTRVNVVNPDLKWETSTTINAGIDFAFADYKWSGSLEVFRKNTTDLLFNFPITQPGPPGNFWVNLDGNVINSGIELTLNTFLVETDNVSFNVGANVSLLRNELEEYDGPNITTGLLTGQGSSNAPTQRLEALQPLNSFFLSEWTGLDSEGINTFANNGDKGHVGDPNPNVLLGISAQLTAGNFDVALNFNGTFGQDIFNETAQSVIPIGNLNGGRNISGELTADPNVESIGNFCATCSRYLEKGDYLKLANATIGYNFGDIGNNFKNFRLYLTGQNLLLFTGYTGFDPEVNTDKNIDDRPSFGIEYIPYPSARTILLGANISF
jgi:iron complex outermembrane receptor protein